MIWNGIRKFTPCDLTFWMITITKDQSGQWWVMMIDHTNAYLWWLKNDDDVRWWWWAEQSKMIFWRSPSPGGWPHPHSIVAKVAAIHMQGPGTVGDNSCKRGWHMSLETKWLRQGNCGIHCWVGWCLGLIHKRPKLTSTNCVLQFWDFALPT